MTVAYGWDPKKRAANIVKHKIDFLAVEAFEWRTAVVEADTRESYGEVRLLAFGLIGQRVHVLVYTLRRSTVWIISLRRASLQEATEYAAQD